MDPSLQLDIALANEVNNGSRAALERVVRRHLAPVYGYVLHRLGPGKDELAARITSDTFDEAMRGMRRYPRGEKTVPMRHWLLRLASRRIARLKLKKPRHSDRVDGAGDDLRELQEAVAELKGKQGAAVALALFDEMPPEEIASALGVSRKAAMRSLRQALRHLGRAYFTQSEDWSLDG
ncbi:MAG: sigma-70 family RNA polymerase sigma factor [Chloroflexota bacterium]|nr:sigma-70 family RNA polymerase sigma factor [Chloroflexota bacterium]MDQ5866157.1 sigma-70 family RNA polymerase sigma factor [Chloroflexota bacterium]